MNYFRTAKENAPTREERLRRLEEESLRQEEAERAETAAAQAALKQPNTDDLPPKSIREDLPLVPAPPYLKKRPLFFGGGKVFR